MDHLGLLEYEVQAMADAFAGSDADAPVAACPGWAVRDLARHVTTLHRWVRDALDSSQAPAFVESGGEGDGVALAEAYSESATAMTARMRELPADHPCWTFDQTNQTAAFWHRRQLHEISVHRFDVAPYPMADDLATDGLDEAIDFFLPRRLDAGRATPPPGSLRLVGPDRTWVIGEGEPSTVVEGSPSELLLSLWGRGDLLPETWRTAGLMP